MRTRTGRGRGLILVLDDDPTIQEVLRDCLRADGYRVAGATTFAEAGDALSHTRFDLVLADVLSATTTYPARDAVRLMEQIRTLAGYTPVVLFTARGESDVAPLEAQGFHDLLRKPFDLDELVAVVEQHLPASPCG